MTPILVPTLAELHIELDRLQSQSVRAWGAISGEMGSPEHDASCDLAVKASDAVDGTIEAIAEQPAACLTELRAKAQALHLIDQAYDGFKDMDDLDKKLIRQLIAGLLDEGIV